MLRYKISFIAACFLTFIISLSARTVFFEATLAPISEGEGIIGGEGANVAIEIHQDGIDFEFKFSLGQKPEEFTVDIGGVLTFSPREYSDFHSSNGGLYFQGFSNGSPIFYANTAIQDFRTFSGTLQHEGALELFAEKNDIPISISGDMRYTNSGSLLLTEDNITQWLENHGFPSDSDLSIDHNGDGVSLLLAYALDLDPNLDLTNDMPSPVLDDGFLYFRYNASRKSIVYRTLSRIDMEEWSGSNFVLLPTSGSRRVSAIAVPDEGSVFMKLVVSADQNL